jgi:hypothetical protein
MKRLTVSTQNPRAALRGLISSALQPRHVDEKCSQVASMETDTPQNFKTSQNPNCHRMTVVDGGFSLNTFSGLRNVNRHTI